MLQHRVRREWRGSWTAVVVTRGGAWCTGSRSNTELASHDSQARAVASTQIHAAGRLLDSGASLSLSLRRGLRTGSTDSLQPCRRESASQLQRAAGCLVEGSIKFHCIRRSTIQVYSHADRSLGQLENMHQGCLQTEPTFQPGCICLTPAAFLQVKQLP